MNKKLRDELKDMILRHPPEIALTAKMAPGYDRIREKDFFRKMAFWKHPGVDTTCFALQTLQLIKLFYKEFDFDKRIKYFIDQNQVNFIRFILDCYDKRTGGFLQTKNSKFPTLHSTQCVLGMTKAFWALKDDEKLSFDDLVGKEKIKKFLSVEGDKSEIVDNIINFILSCYDIEKGGFNESPIEFLHEMGVKKIEPSLNPTSSAIWISTNLETTVFEELNKKYKNLDVTKLLLDFLLSHKESRGNWLSFKNALSDKRPWVCSLYYTERIFRNLNIPIPDDQLIKFYNFLVMAKQEESGFCAGDSYSYDEKMSPNIIHTKDALSLLRRYLSQLIRLCQNNKFYPEPKEFIKKACKDVIKFIESAYIYGGFGTAEIEKYLPNIYSTRLAFDIIRYVRFFSRELKFEMPNLEFINPNDTYTFVQSCFDTNQGAFRGFPLEVKTNRKYVPDEFVEKNFSLKAA
jgi:hypothetical protein